ncbi:MAG: hypothetical protein LBR65_01245 [Culturomica sp.]|jgi:formylglycine-generating enzyme required for sulfatase activity|nr:hypothetical protein [Culturomica sp.]
MRYFCFIISIFLVLSLPGANLRITGQPRITGVSGSVATIEYSVAWDNSWKNEYNYDGAYLFGKYRVEGMPAWYTIRPAATGHEAVTAGFGCFPSTAGLFLFPSENRSGTAEATVRFQWALDGETVTASLVESGKVTLSFEGIEMVYIPPAPFVAGDGSSENSFRTTGFGVISPSRDLINTTSGYTFSASGGSNVTGPADRTNNSQNSNNSWYNTPVPSWWQVDFKSNKTVRRFGISSLWNTSAIPGGTWYLLGSANTTIWDTLWRGSPDAWSRSRISYPVQKSIQVSAPGSYRYYRIYIPTLNREWSHFYSDVRIANIAMTEEELLPEEPAPVLIAGKNHLLPTEYPSGYEGFFLMKYEISQEQYLSFLNKLDASSQYDRTLGGALDGVAPGSFIYGNEETPAFRNNIVLIRIPQSGEPAIFACNLNPEKLPNQRDDGHTIACNFLSIADMLAYADWCGLRPAGELEYEKASRPPWPFAPVNGEYAWNTDVFTAPGSLNDPGTVSEYFTSGNALAEKAELGPVRSGSFTRSRQGRMQNGISFWGVEDLSGNLAEIYYNTETEGRQFNRNTHGSGTLDLFGRSTIDPKEWPSDVAAFGIRGGSFRSTKEELSTSDRRYMDGSCFSDIRERREDVSFRLAYSVSASFTTTLRLENGKISGSQVVYDTICGPGEYRILDSRQEEDLSSTYTWYRSTDNSNWELMEGEYQRDLVLNDLTQNTTPNTIRYLYFKRQTATSSGTSESAPVGLLIGSGYRLNKQEELLIPCMESEGFTVTTLLPASFHWRCMDNGKILPSSVSATSSHLDARTEDYKQYPDDLPNGRYTLELKITLAGKCEHFETLTVRCERKTVDPFTTAKERLTWSGDTYRVARLWGGPDKQQWDIENSITGTLAIGAETGTISGLNATFCSLITVRAVCAAYPDKVYTKVVSEQNRNFAYSGAIKTMQLVPGDYEIICKGAGGGNDGNVGGIGGLASGTITLTNLQVFNIYVGGQGATGATNTGGGWNGGGNAGTSGASGGGGGATDIRANGTALANRIMVAGGAGGGGNASGATGAHGGGVDGGANNAGQTATQTSGFQQGQAQHRSGDGGGGGGGYWAAWAATADHRGGGGSGYVSGHASCALHSSGLQFRNAILTLGGAGSQAHGSVSIRVLE